jgi:chromate transporter
MVWAISVAYVHYGGLPWMQSLFYGIGASVIGIIARSAVKLTKVTLKTNRPLWAIFAVVAVTTAWTEREIIWLFPLAGLLTVVLSRPSIKSDLHHSALLLVPITGTASSASAAVAPSLPAIFLFFAKAGAVVFGSGLAIVPFLYGEVVQTQGWLNDRQFLDAVAVAMITPGPVVITVAFVGYLIGGFPGMTAAALGVFLPVYLFVIIPAPYFRRHRSQPAIKAFVEGVTAAATGAIAGAAYVLAARAIIDVGAALLAMATFAILTRWKISELWLIGAAAVIGLLFGRGLMMVGPVGTP